MVVDHSLVSLLMLASTSSIESVWALLKRGYYGIPTILRKNALIQLYLGLPAID
jgi:hypothetical protein